MKKCFTLALAALITATSALAIGPTKRVEPLSKQSEVLEIARAHKEKTAQLPQTKKQMKNASKLSRTRAFRPVVNQDPFGLQKAQASTTLFGTVIYSESEDMQGGVYEMPVSGACSFTPVFQSTSVSPNGGGCLVENTYVSIYYFGFWGMYFVYVDQFDVDSWELISETSSSDLTLVANDLAYDPTTGNIYGCFLNENADGFELGVLDLDNCTRSTIGVCEDPYMGLAAAPDGTLYGITTSGVLHSIDKTSGTPTVIGNVGIDAAYASSAVCDPVSGALYYSVNPEDGTAWLYSVDTTTGAGTPIYQFTNNEEVVGLYIPAPAAADKAPDQVTGLVASFENGSLSGTVSFVAPSTLFDGSAPAAGENLTYSIQFNGTEVATGTCSYAQSVSVPVTVDASGTYKVVVTVANAEGTSPKAKTELFIGFDELKPVTNVVLSWADGTATLTWDACAGTINGGYYVPSAVLYKVIRADGTVAADAVAGTSFSEALAEPETVTSYSYSVVAYTDNATSAATESNVILLGTLSLPYNEPFDTEDALGTFSIIDANNDGQTWVWYSGTMKINWHTTNDMDDWIVSAAVKMEAGKMYTISFDYFCGGSSFPERLEAFIGTSASVDGMTTQIMEKTVVNSVDATTFSYDFICPADGKYYLGIHGCSDADEYSLYVDNISISAPIKGSAPDAVSDLVITPDATGALNATVAFTAPSKTVGGDALSSITKIEVANGTEVLATVDAPAVGSAVSCPVTVTAAGDYTFTVTAYNADGAGRSASASAYIGVNVPGLVTNLVGVESTPGTVTLTWKAPVVDVDGNAFNPDNATYTVVSVINGTQTIEAEDLTECTFTHKVCEADDEQQFVYYGIFAESAGGLGSGAVSDLIPVGKPYELPYVESFADGGLSYILGTSTVAGYGQWYIATDESFTDITSYDGDNGFAYMKGSYLDDEAVIFTGKIDITGTAPVLSLQSNHFAADNINSLYIKVNGEKIYDEPQTGDEGWTKITVPMSAYLGQTVQVTIGGVVNSHVYTIIDCIAIEEPLDYNLQALNLIAPAKIAANTEATISAKINNDGSKDIEGYTVNLLIDGKVADTKTANAVIASGEKQEVEFTKVFTPAEAGVHTVAIQVVCDKDEYDGDDTTKDASVNVTVPNYPTVTIAGEIENGVAKISWSAPVLSGEGQSAVLTEGFESEDVESFTMDAYSDWTFYNGNTANTYGIQGATFTNAGEGFGWILFDGPSAGLSTWNGYDSDRAMISFAHTSGANDAWMISPALSGDAQTITFYAKCATTSYGAETYELLYSTTGTAQEDFIAIGVDGATTNSLATTEWTQIAFDVPAGAKYFAIRCTSNDVFAFFVDEVVYTGGAPDYSYLTLKGYNVYRDGKLITAEPITSTEYLDTEAEEGVHKYAVTAVYAEGESALSNEVELDNSGVANVLAADVTIEVVGRHIVVNAPEAINVAINGADGRVLMARNGKNSYSVAVAPGVYMVKAGSRIAKVVVK
ncbi:MAG: choice-of-anchor J domain-containing protein [Bacteroidales bacterium]|nr:choice-of-anchor J domain-containing protein [Bacteroidales bacterium]